MLKTSAQTIFFQVCIALLGGLKAGISVKDAILKPAYQPIVFLVLTVLLSAQFIANPVGIAPGHVFDNWQLNGQARVLGGIVADQHGLDKGGARMGRVYFETTDLDDLDDGAVWEDTYDIYADYPEGTDVQFDPYPTQFGFQQIFLSKVALDFGLSDFRALQAFVAVLTAAALAGIFLFYRQIFGVYFALLFIALPMIGPYFITMARNLYWFPALLFLPALAAAWVYLDRRPWARASGLALVSLAMFLKSASNYEYITTVTLLACAPFVAAPLFGRSGSRDIRWVSAAAVGTACVVGFCAAFLMHASTRGETLVEGVQSIYVEDIQRRTYGDPADYEGETAESMEASALDVLWIHVQEKYPGRRDMIVPGKIFLVLIVLSVGLVAWNVARRRPEGMRDLLLLIAFFSVPASWFVLAKGHSFTQTHINFVLWYIGFMPALFFVCTQTAISTGMNLLDRSSIVSRRGV